MRTVLNMAPAFFHVAPGGVGLADRNADHELAATLLGHASVLFRIGGMTVLADPVLSNRVGIGFGLVTGGARAAAGGRWGGPAPATTLYDGPGPDWTWLR